MGAVPRDPSEPITAEMWAELRERYPSPLRVVWAMRLAKDLETCRALLAGQPVDPARVHTDELEHAMTATLVQLVRPIDVIHGRAA